MHIIKNEYLHENNQNLNKNGYGNNGGENGGFTGGIKKAPGERPLCRPARDGRDDLTLFTVDILQLFH